MNLSKADFVAFWNGRPKAKYIAWPYYKLEAGKFPRISISPNVPSVDWRGLI